MNDAHILSSLAMADARHDFKHLATQFHSLLQESLPGTAEYIPDEDATLQYIINIRNPTLTIKPYDNNNTEYNDYNEIYKILTNSISKSLAILCDASMCADFVRQLSKNTIGNVYYINNREQENDGGPNISDPDKIKEFNIITDATKGNIYYYSYKNTNNYFHKFGSIYDLSLSLTQLSVSDKRLTSNYNFKDNKTPALSPKLDDLLTMHYEDMLEEDTLRSIHDIFIQKRSGDFLQVLSCFQKERLYKIDSVVKNLKDCEVYFCSTDRIAIAYAIYLGINCIRKVLTPTISEMRIYSNTNTVKSMNIIAEFNSHMLHKESILQLFQDGLRIYTRLEKQFKVGYNKIHDAISINEIKECVANALYYYELQNAYGNTYYIQLVELYIKDSSKITSEIDKKGINDAIQIFTKYNSIFKDNTYTNVIKDKYYPEFDPTNFIVKKTKHKNAYSYNVMYGQSILYLLYMSEIKELKSFVQNCIGKITDLIDNDDLHIVYSYFMERLEKKETTPVIGGSIRNLASFFTYCDYLYWCYTSQESAKYRLHMLTISNNALKYSLSPYVIIPDLIETMIDEIKIPYIPYLSKLNELSELTERQLRIQSFLKMRKITLFKNNKTLKSRSNKYAIPQFVKVIGGKRKRTKRRIPARE
jgi:hypothetical protein